MERVGTSVRDGHLNQRVLWNDKDLRGWKEILRLLSSAQKLEEDQDGGRDVRDTVGSKKGGLG